MSYFTSESEDKQFYSPPPLTAQESGTYSLDFFLQEFIFSFSSNHQLLRHSFQKLLFNACGFVANSTHITCYLNYTDRLLGPRLSSGESRTPGWNMLSRPVGLQLQHSQDVPEGQSEGRYIRNQLVPLAWPLVSHHLFQVNVSGVLMGIQWYKASKCKNSALEVHLVCWDEKQVELSITCSLFCALGRAWLNFLLFMQPKVLWDFQQNLMLKQV